MESASLHVATRRAIALFVAGLALIAAVTLLEHTAPIRWMFENPVGAVAYMSFQTATFAAALVCAAIGGVRGARRDRLVVAVPVALVLFYFTLLFWGPG